MATERGPLRHLFSEEDAYAEGEIQHFPGVPMLSPSDADAALIAHVIQIATHTPRIGPPGER